MSRADDSIIRARTLSVCMMCVCVVYMRLFVCLFGRCGGAGGEGENGTLGKGARDTWRNYSLYGLCVRSERTRGSRSDDVWFARLRARDYHSDISNHPPIHHELLRTLLPGGANFVRT